jgi:hypothetical protein
MKWLCLIKHSWGQWLQTESARRERRQCKRCGGDQWRWVV